MSNILSLQTGKVQDPAAMLSALDDLRAAIERGEVVAFVAAGIDASDLARGWCGSVGGVTRLRMMGAIASLTHTYGAGWGDD